MSSTPIGDGHRFPACAKPWHGPLAWIDASAGGGRSDEIMLLKMEAAGAEGHAPRPKQKAVVGPALTHAVLSRGSMLRRAEAGRTRSCFTKSGSGGVGGQRDT